MEESLRGEGRWPALVRGGSSRRRACFTTSLTETRCVRSPSSRMCVSTASRFSSGCSGGGPTDTWPACRMPAGGYEDAHFELKAPSSLHGLAEKVLLARKNCSPVRPRPTHLPACPLPAAYVDLCVFVCCRLLARTELRARRHVEHGRIPTPSRTSSTALGFAAARGVQSPNRVFAPSLCVCCCPHAHPLQA